MAREAVRRCSHCGNNGHNSRTCNGKGCFKLFGVKIDLKEKEEHESSIGKMKLDEYIRKSKSMGNLQACNAEHTAADSGYLSDGIIHDRAKARERKRGTPWTEDEHRSFLTGLEKLGKGDWKGIAKNFVHSRTATQVASHAQKYFIRMIITEKKKRRSSLFDIPLKESSPSPQPSPASPSHESSEFTHQDGTSAPATFEKPPISPVARSHVPDFHCVPYMDGASAPATFEKPPISPVARSHVPDFHCVPYMVGVSGNGNGHGFPANEVVVPTVSFVPVMNFPGQSYVCLPNSHGNFATCAPYQVQVPHGPSQVQVLRLQ